jgi:hypothetical protein
MWFHQLYHEMISATYIDVESSLVINPAQAVWTDLGNFSYKMINSTNPVYNSPLTTAHAKLSCRFHACLEYVAVRITFIVNIHAKTNRLMLVK